MPRSPLLPVLRVGAAAVVGCGLLYCPRRETPLEASAQPGVWATDINDAPPESRRPGQKATGPLKGQKRPPCEPTLETQLAGACWIAAKARPPCPAGLYEGGGDCLVPVMAGKRPDTSILP